jgi:sulfur-carrier protein
VTQPGAAHDVRVVLPTHLRTLAGAPREVSVAVLGEVTQRSVLDALEANFPTLGGTIRDRATARRRPFIRFFACQEDLSHEPPDALLPDEVASGREPFIVLGAIAGG